LENGIKQLHNQSISIITSQFKSISNFRSTDSISISIRINFIFWLKLIQFYIHFQLIHFQFYFHFQLIQFQIFPIHFQLIKFSFTFNLFNFILYRFLALFSKYPFKILNKIFHQYSRLKPNYKYDSISSSIFKISFYIAFT
jgi:hypothetical protein